jgi:hypothetical protein
MTLMAPRCVFLTTTISTGSSSQTSRGAFGAAYSINQLHMQVAEAAPLASGADENGVSVVWLVDTHWFALTRGKSMRYEPPAISFHLGETHPKNHKGSARLCGVVSAFSRFCFRRDILDTLPGQRHARHLLWRRYPSAR